MKHRPEPLVILFIFTAVLCVSFFLIEIVPDMVGVCSASKVSIGMTETALDFACGKGLRRHSTDVGFGPETQVVYGGGLYVYLKNHRVSSIQANE